MARMAVDIRSVLIPITGERVLLPNATVAEVITYSTPDAVEGTPAWVLGRVVWRGWRVPVFSLPMLAGWSRGENEAGAKIAVLKALGGNPDMPFMAMVTQGFPRLVTVTADTMEVLEGEAAGRDEDEAPPGGATGPGSGPESRAGDEDDEPDLDDFAVDMEYEALSAQAEDSDESANPAGREAETAAETAVPAAPESGGPSEGFDPTAAVVRVAGERAVIPDLVPIERRVAKAIGSEILRSHNR